MGSFAAVALLNWNVPPGPTTTFNSSFFCSQNAFKHPSPDPFVDGDSPKGSGKKVKAAAKKAPKKKKDPNEPQK